MSDFLFTELFNIEDPRMMRLGMIAIDTDQTVGVRSGNWEKIYLDVSQFATKDAFSLFPAGMFHNEDVGDNATLFTKAWLNGFSCIGLVNGVLPVKDVETSTSKWLNSKGIVTSDQIFATRSPHMLNTLFSCFTRYDKNKGLRTRLAPKSSFDQDKFKNFEANGALDKEWIDRPLAARYAIRSCSSKHGLDYFFLIAGSDDLLDVENLLTIAEKKAAALYNIITCDGSFYGTDISGHGVWRSSERSDRAVSNDPVIETSYTNKRSINRLIIGVAYIYNYLQYAKNILGTESFDVLEITAKGCEVIDIDDLIDAYTPAYQYLRNITFMTKLV